MPKKQELNELFQGFDNPTWNRRGTTSLHDRKNGGYPRYTKGELNAQRKKAGIRKVGRKKGSEKKLPPVDDDFGPLDYYGLLQPKKVRTKKGCSHFRRIRPSITPGTILIILWGAHASRRVVFIKKLERSQLLLCTGPKGINGVPFFRIDQAYVIATSIKLDLSGVKIPGDWEDWLVEEPKEKKKRRRSDMNEVGAEEPSEEFLKRVDAWKEKNREAQEYIDGALAKVISKVEYMEGYLKDAFSLRDGEYPHKMQF